MCYSNTCVIVTCALQWYTHGHTHRHRDIHTDTDTHKLMAKAAKEQTFMYAHKVESENAYFLPIIINTCYCNITDVWNAGMPIQANSKARLGLLFCVTASSQIIHIRESNEIICMNSNHFLSLAINRSTLTEIKGIQISIL